MCPIINDSEVPSESVSLIDVNPYKFGPMRPPKLPTEMTRAIATALSASRPQYILETQARREGTLAIMQVLASATKISEAIEEDQRELIDRPKNPIVAPIEFAIRTIP